MAGPVSILATIRKKFRGGMSSHGLDGKHHPTMDRLRLPIRKRDRDHCLFYIGG